MIKLLRKITSLNNLSVGTVLFRLRSETRTVPMPGQIATLLILVMVAVLVFILATVNIGNLSIQATTLSNAADSAALGLASQLASKTNYYLTTMYGEDGSGWRDPNGATNYGEGDDTPAITGKSIGMLSFVVEVIAVVVCVVFSVVSGGAGAVLVGAVAGAITNAAVYGDLDSTMAGVVQGAFVGFSIGSGLQSMGVGVGKVAGLNTGITPITPTLGSQISSAASLTSALYSVAQIQPSYFGEAARQLKGLPEYDAYREGTMLSIFSQTFEHTTNRIISFYQIVYHHHMNDSHIFIIFYREFDSYIFKFFLAN